MKATAATVFSTLLAPLASALMNNRGIFNSKLLSPPPLYSNVDATVPSHTFELPLDHAHPQKGNFSMRYWVSDEYYAGPGSPVIVFNPGEEDASLYTGYLSNRALTGWYAQAIGAAVVLFEHRYWGESSPYQDLTTENLRYLTVKNAIADMELFAKNVRFSFDKNGTSSADKAPWILVGGSYSGALTAFTQSLGTGVFYAYHATSAVVEGISDFWQYTQVIAEYMPKNCSSDVKKVISHVDDILTHGSRSAKYNLKKMFGLESIQANDDFAGALQGGPMNWQDRDVTSGYSAFDQWCDYVENVWPSSGNAVPGANGVGLEKALAGYAKWAKEVSLPGTCASYGYWTGDLNTDCFNTHNSSSPIYTDRSVGNPDLRQWVWLLANEPFGWSETGKHGWDKGAIVSRLVDEHYWRKQFNYYFPREGSYTFGLAQGKTVAENNRRTGGWHPSHTKRLIWVNGEVDPWRPATVSSPYRPGGPLQSTDAVPVHVIKGGVHCSDLIIKNALGNADVMAVVNATTETMKEWVADYYKQ